MKRNLTASQLTIRYIIALTLVALLSCLGQTVIQRQLVNHDSDALVINVAGRQRMLSQRLTKNALKLGMNPKDAAALAEFRDTLDLWSRAHNGLQNGDPEMKLPGNNSAAVTALFQATEPYFSAMQTSARSLLPELPANERTDVIDENVRYIASNERSFLSHMDQIVSQYQMEAQSKVETLKRIDFALLALTLCVLLLEGLFVFRPAVRRIAETISSLEQARSELQASRNSLASTVEQRTAELRLSELQFRNFFELAAVGMSQVQPHTGKLLCVNSALCRMLGYTHEELLQKTFTELTHPDDRVADYELFHRMARGEIPFYDTEMRYVRKDGQVVWAHVTASMLYDEHGKPERTISVVKDITERRAAREALKRSEQHFRTLAELSPQIVFMFDDDGRMEYFNQRWRMELGEPPPIGSKPDLASLVHPDDIERTQEAWQTALKDHTPYQIEHRLKIVSGDYRWYLDRALPVVDEVGAIRWIGSCTDVHEQKQITLRAQEASRHKDEFVAMISHELRTPLTAILGWTSLLRSGAVGPDMIAKGTDIIERNARAQAKLVNDLMDMSRIISGKIKLDKKPVMLCPIVDAAVETVLPAAALKQIRLNVNNRTTSPVLVRGEESRLQQVFTNLLTNAIKFTPENGRVEVTVVDDHDHAFIEVSDSGPGIPEELLPHIFERFRQGSFQPEREKGLGLGLAIVKSFVELHGGKVTASSGGNLGGATFTVELPVLRPSRRLAAVEN